MFCGRSSELMTIHLEDGDVQEPVLNLYKQEGFGRPYRWKIGVEDSYRWLLCMNPLQSSLLSETEFLEMDVTFENSHEFPYLLNLTCFSYVTMRCTCTKCSTPLQFTIAMFIPVGFAVAHARMTSMTKEAYAAALRGIFECCNQDNDTNVVDTLKGVIVDWATAQIEGLKAAAGDEKAEQLLRGCKVRTTGSCAYNIQHSQYYMYRFTL